MSDTPPAVNVQGTAMIQHTQSRGIHPAYSRVL